MRIWLCSLAAFLMLCPHAAEAQDYPSRVIRAVLPFSPGGLGDTVLRAIGQGLTKSLGQGIAVENRPGAGTQIGAQACATAPADGYTFCMLPVDALSYQPFITKNLPYDADRSFEDWANLVGSTAPGGPTSYRKSIRIEVVDKGERVLLAYDVLGCWPSEYRVLPELSENLTLVTEGWQRDRSV